MSFKDGKGSDGKEDKSIKRNMKLLYELVLIISGVFVFRSLWTLMDGIEFFNRIPVHIILFVLGVMLSVYSLHKIVD